MGMRFRKSVKLGGARINFSKSGVGYSFGGKGYRVTKKTGGGYRTTASIPGTGVSHVKDYSDKRSTSTRRSSSGGSGSSGNKPQKGTWKIVIGIFLILGGAIKTDSSSVVNALMILCGGGFLWSGIRTRQNYNYCQKYSPKPDVVERLANASDEELAETKDYTLKYIQEHRREIRPTNDMARLLRAIRAEENRRQGLEPEPETMRPQKRSTAAPIIFWLVIAICAIGVLVPSTSVDNAPEQVVGDTPVETVPVVEPEAAQEPEQQETKSEIETTQTSNDTSITVDPEKEPEALPEPAPAPETPAIVTPEPEPIVEVPAVIPEAPVDPLSWQQYEETPEQSVEQTPETEPETTSIIVYITNSGDRYHSYGCRHLEDSCIETTLDAAKAIGLTPCGHCHPPQ